MSVVGGLSNSLQPFRCATCGCGQPLDCARDARILEDKTSCEVADPVGRDRVLSNTSPGGATQFIIYIYIFCVYIYIRHFLWKKYV